MKNLIYFVIFSFILSIAISASSSNCDTDLLPLEFGSTTGSTRVLCLSYRDVSYDDSMFIAGKLTHHIYF